jgi:alpha-methylacyl-CoA racemase
MALFYSLNAQGQWTTERGCNLLDGGAPFYAVYETGDGKYVSIGAIEPQFYAFLMDKLGLDGEEGPTREDPRNWPVLDFQEAPHHPHNRARSTYIEVNGLTQPAPAPRFSRTPSAVKFPPREPGSDMQTLLDDWGVASEGAQL